MPTNTYVELRKETVAVATSTVTFDLTGISGYTDLEIVCNYASTNALSFLVMQLNGDTAGNYALTSLVGNGSSSANTQGTNLSPNWIGYQVGCQNVLGKTMSTIKLLSYANSHAPKTYLAKNGNIGTPTYTGVEDIVGLWNNTAPITSITLRNNTGGTFYNFAVGSTFSIYGIKAVGGDTAVKALGGTVTEDSTYFYHTFKGSSTFTPLQSLTVDYLVVAGGGGGYNGDASGRSGGGGGAGGLRSTVGSTGGSGSLESALSMTAVPHTILVGGGGYLSNGSNSGIIGGAISILSTGGGVGGNASGNGGAGGSGGGSSAGGSAASGGAASPSGQGFAGGSTSLSPQNNYISAAGGGAGGVGENGSTGGSSSVGGAGRTITAWSNATSTGFGGAGKYAGGGGGGTGQFAGATLGTNLGFGGGNGGYTNPSAVAATSGAANTGSGGGGGNSNTDGRPFTGGVGGSGIVILRYAKA